MMTIRADQQRQRVSRISALLCVMLAALVWSSCSGDTSGGGEETVEAGVALEITPEFRVTGVENIRDEVFLQDVFLGIGEVRLEPLEEDYQGLVYATSVPMRLHFDLSAEQWTVAGPQVMLPHSGEFRVSIRFQPVEVEHEDANREMTTSSMRVDGMMARVTGVPDVSEKAAAGEPVPLPWRPGKDGDAKSAPVVWVPWTYSSQAMNIVTLNDVSFNNERKQKLVIAFDVATWLEDAFRPINETIGSAVEAREGDSQDMRPAPNTDFNPVDVSDPVNRMNDNFNDVGFGGEAYVL